MLKTLLIIPITEKKITCSDVDYEMSGKIAEDIENYSNHWLIA